jgi:hypothetical protein
MAKAIPERFEQELTIQIAGRGEVATTADRISGSEYSFLKWTLH